jgi:1,4-dihydroxy-6-naphthoate synthase
MGDVKQAIRTLTFAHSPDPDDVFMYYGFEKGAVALPPGYALQPLRQDIETLNQRALQGEYEITAVSAHAYVYCSDRYWLLSCGASVGRGYGPILVKRRMASIDNRKWRIAIPGKWTTAVLALDLWLKEQPDIQVEKVLMPFDQILPAVKRGEIDAGLIIHEGQLTYSDEGLEKIWDAGEWWQKKTGLPLPLGLAVIRKDLGEPLAKALSAAFRKSIEYAHAHQEDALAYALQYGRGLNSSLGKRFIGMYVNQDTFEQGNDVVGGLKQLYNQAYNAKLIPQEPNLTLI